ncbi:hypothetical protein ABH932_002376 [Streptacidiphilus sp. MAP5-52]
MPDTVGIDAPARPEAPATILELDLYRGTRRG